MSGGGTNDGGTAASPSFVIGDLPADDPELVERLAQVTFAAARVHSRSWIDSLDDARHELDDALERGGVVRVAMAADRPLGWVAATRADARAWEIHPLLVDPECHGRGVGRRLVADVEAFARAAGARTMTLSTSDSVGATTIHGVDLFPDPLRALADLALLPGHEHHALGFWRRTGYVVSGVLPDAEGPGTHAIFLSRRIGGDVS